MPLRLSTETGSAPVPTASRYRVLLLPVTTIAARIRRSLASPRLAETTLWLASGANGTGPLGSPSKSSGWITPSYTPYRCGLAVCG